ncbi:MAG: HD domain-containing phosphohydrolase [Spirochaetota bacterium]
MKDENDFISNLIKMMSSVDTNDKKTLIEIKKEFEAFIYLLKNTNNKMVSIVHDIPQMIDIAIEIPNEVVRKSCLRMIVDILIEINKYNTMCFDEHHKKKLLKRIQNELYELKQYKENVATKKNEEYVPYEELHIQIIEKSKIIDTQNIKLQNLHTFIHDILKLMIHFMELKEPYLLSHSMKVSYLANSLVQAINIDIDVQLVKYAALMHDIGRITINDPKVLSSRTLYDDELYTIRRHTIEGYNLVKNLSFDKCIKDAILYHHESYDGTGYPEGLKGKSIPIIARIIKIADVYDALTSDRPYRIGHTKQEALAIMYQQNEKFDPELLEAFFIMM